jgi:nitrile hydratase accessory protein
MVDQATRDLLQAVPSIPRDAEGPVFHEPWEARAFAMALALYERRVFTWTEWTAMLAAEIGAAESEGADSGYYRHWLAALERLIVGLGVTTTQMLDYYRDAWEAAAVRTPHGRPISLEHDPEKCAAISGLPDIGA